MRTDAREGRCMEWGGSEHADARDVLPASDFLLTYMEKYSAFRVCTHNSQQPPSNLLCRILEQAFRLATLCYPSSARIDASPAFSHSSSFSKFPLYDRLNTTTAN